ncbi:MULTISPECIES: MacS family sensor histidine kinase [unclassified Nocardioides]|uniref:MacS family sensor histidine kinase n=1 Tax=unclassified Nocardioides TaxID=2615069 RepID=UPI003608379D
MSTSPAAIAVENRLFRALAVLRLVLLANTMALIIVRSDDLRSPAVGAACVVVMAAWTGFATWAYAEPRRRTPLLLVADLGLAVAILLASPLVMVDDVTTSVPSFWIVAALAAWSIRYRWIGGLVAGLALAAADLARQDIDRSDYGNAFLLVVGGTVLGFVCGSLQQLATERDEAERAAAIAAERARLARAVHDGVLQVLALVQRRGRELGGEAAELGRLAGEQERELRALIRAQDDVTGPRSAGTVDVAAELARLERRAAVTVSTPGAPVELPAETARELVAAASACLDNVRNHVGEDAPAWVLLQAFPDRVELSVRDEGPGIPTGRLEQAAAQGRLGVAESIRGRVAELGGTADLTTGSFGTEWEIVVPLGRGS